MKRNLAMLGGVTLAAMLCIWSLGGLLAIIVGRALLVNGGRRRWRSLGPHRTGIRLHRKRRGP